MRNARSCGTSDRERAVWCGAFGFAAQARSANPLGKTPTRTATGPDRQPVSSPQHPVGFTPRVWEAPRGRDPRRVCPRVCHSPRRPSPPPSVAPQHPRWRTGGRSTRSCVPPSPSPRSVALGATHSVPLLGVVRPWCIGTGPFSPPGRRTPPVQGSGAASVKPSTHTTAFGYDRMILSKRSVTPGSPSEQSRMGMSSRSV